MQVLIVEDEIVLSNAVQKGSWSSITNQDVVKILVDRFSPKALITFLQLLLGMHNDRSFSTASWTNTLLIHGQYSALYGQQESMCV